ncbi:MAG TPA: hypothetical protein VGP82_03420 [Ktedonobacterales bacterium]|nr:hypothetical protein [Ktedonobacterales bacterium]
MNRTVATGLARMQGNYVEVYLRVAGTDQEAFVAGKLAEADTVGLLLTDHTGEFPTDQAGIWIPMDNVAFVSMRPLPSSE